MGQIVKQVSATTTKYYWYPGERKEWLRALLALGTGFGVFALLWLVTRDLLVAVVAGTSVAAAVTGSNFGRRDARALDGFPKLGDKAARRAAVGHTGRAAWRALAHGCGGAGAAVLIMNLPDRGLLADWILPVVPAVVGALGHQAGMLHVRLGVTVSTVGPAKRLLESP
ncbi:hypothetical protein ACIA8K_38090 [Catenuloplanes sp. NPDC051500]|uniref:hypothetical protein n=1 Tax=Catenuloplanes sp. NPDC051500 TaxID=3363959 RepID=UPI00379A2F72